MTQKQREPGQKGAKQKRIKLKFIWRCGKLSAKREIPNQARSNRREQSGMPLSVEWRNSICVKKCARQEANWCKLNNKWENLKISWIIAHFLVIYLTQKSITANTEPASQDENWIIERKSAPKRKFKKLLDVNGER